MQFDYGFSDDQLTDLYDGYYHDEAPQYQEVQPEEPEFVTSEKQYMDYTANAGFPLWLDPSTLVFLFSVRYSSPAFTGTFLQEDYRIATHREFSSLIKDIIMQKVAMMKRHPYLYDKKTQTKKPLNESLIGRDNVIEIASALGINAADLDVYTVVADVAESLEKMLMDFLKQHPHMSPSDKKYAIDFIDSQLWDDDSKQLWRAVSAEEMSRLFEYRRIPRGVKVIQALDEYVRYSFTNGAYQAMDVENADVSGILNDDVVEAVLDALKDNDNAPEDEKTEEAWVMQDAIEGAVNGDDVYGEWY